MTLTFRDTGARSNGPTVADRAECIAAIEALSDSELRTVKGYAASRTFALRGVRYYADAEDLLHEAIVRTLEGTRKWKPQRVDMAKHLKGCVRSIAHQYDEEGRRRSEKPPDEMPSEDEECLYLREMVDTARLLLKPDAVAFEVFNLLLEGHAASAVRSILNIGGKTYNAARRRITRRLRANPAAWR